MSDQTQPPATPAPEPAPAPETRAAAPTPRRGGGLALFALVLAVAALLAAGALFYRDYVQRAQADLHTRALLQHQAESLAQLRGMLAKQRGDSRSAREQLVARLSGLQQRVEAQQRQLDKLTATDRSDWQLSEAEYLMKLANQRVQLGGDPKTAIELLTSADRILRGVDDSALLPTRAALAQDIAALKSVTVVDTDGIYLEIAAVAGQAQQLHLIEPPAMQTAAPAAAGTTLGERLRGGLDAALHKLFQLVQIRHRDQPYRPLLAPQYEAALRQNVRLAFEQAQTGLLMGNQKLYEHSLAEARQLLSTYYTLDQHATQAVLAQIDGLKARRVAVSLPDISKSLHALKTYIEKRRTRTAGGAQP